MQDNSRLSMRVAAGARKRRTTMLSEKDLDGVMSKIEAHEEQKEEEDPFTLELDNTRESSVKIVGVRMEQVIEEEDQFKEDEDEREPTKVFETRRMPR